MQLEPERKRDGRWHLNPVPSPVWMVLIRVLSIQANKEKGLGRSRRRRGWADLKRSEIALAPCSSSFPRGSSDIQVISQLRSIDTHSRSRENVSCLQMSFISSHTLPACFHHLFARIQGLLNAFMGRDQKLSHPPPH